MENPYSRDWQFFCLLFGFSDSVKQSQIHLFLILTSLDTASLGHLQHTDIALNPIPTWGGLLGSNHLKQFGISTVLWLESPRILTLFTLVPVWSHWSYFWKKNYEILRNWKNKIFRFNTKGAPNPKSGDSFSKVFGNFYPILTKLCIMDRIDHISMLGNSNYQIFAF